MLFQIVLHLKKYNFSTTLSMIKGSTDSNHRRNISLAEFSTKGDRHLSNEDIIDYIIYFLYLNQNKEKITPEESV